MMMNKVNTALAITALTRGEQMGAMPSRSAELFQANPISDGHVTGRSKTCNACPIVIA